MKRIFLYLAVAFVAVITASITLSTPIVATAEQLVTVTTARQATTTTLRPARTRPTTATTPRPSVTSRETTPPGIDSFTSLDGPSVTAGTAVEYTLNFDENVTGVAPVDFINVGTASFCSFAVAGSNQVWTITVSGCVGGTIKPRFNAYGAIDTANNNGPTSSVVTTTEITAGADTTRPSVTSFESSSPANVDAFEDVVYTITFSEWVTGVSLGDFSNSGTAKGCSFSGAGNDTTWTMTVSGCAGGTIIPQFAADGAVDRSGNTGPRPARTADDTITAGTETVPPTVLSFSSSSISPTSQDIVYTIVYSEDVEGVDGSDFENSPGTGRASFCSFSVSGSGSSRRVTASDCFRGTVLPRLKANSIQDTSGNLGPSAVAVATVTIFALPETTPPEVNSFTSASDGQTVAAETPVVFTLVFSEPVNGVTPVDFTNTGSASDCSFSVTGAGSSRSVTVSGCVGGTIIPRFAANGAFDTANNEGPTEAFTSTSTVTAGGTAPTTTTTTTVASVYPPTSETTTTTSTTVRAPRSATTTTLRPVRIRIR